MRLQHQPGDDLGIRLVADVDDPRHREWRESGIARSLVLREEAESARTRLVDEDDVGLAADLHIDRVLRATAVVE